MNDRLYPEVPRGGHPHSPRDGDAFRLSKASEALETLKQQVKHYEGVRKKYDRFRDVSHNIGVGAGVIGVSLSSAALGTSLTGIGVPVAIPLGAIGGLSGVVSVVAAAVVKKLAVKVSKHEQIVALAKGVVSTIQNLVSKALIDNKIDDKEFSMILSEVDKFEKMKAEIRKDVQQQSSGAKKGSPDSGLTSSMAEQVREELIRSLSRGR